MTLRRAIEHSSFGRINTPFCFVIDVSDRFSTLRLAKCSATSKMNGEEISLRATDANYESDETAIAGT